MLRLLLVKEEGTVGGDVAGVAEPIAIHEVGPRLLLPLAVLQKANYVISAKLTLIIAYLPVSR